PISDNFTTAQTIEMVAGTSISTFVGSIENQADIYAAPTPRVTDRPYKFLAQMGLDNGSPDPNEPGHATLTYSLPSVSFGRIPARLSFRVHDSALATVRQTFRQQGRHIAFVDELHIPADPALAGFSVLGSEFFPPAGGAVTEFFTPGPWQTFSNFIAGP